MESWRKNGCSLSSHPIPVITRGYTSWERVIDAEGHEQWNENFNILKGLKSLFQYYHPSTFFRRPSSTSQSLEPVVVAAGAKEIQETSLPAGEKEMKGQDPPSPLPDVSSTFASPSLCLGSSSSSKRRGAALTVASASAVVHPQEVEEQQHERQLNHKALAAMIGTKLCCFDPRDAYLSSTDPRNNSKEGHLISVAEELFH